MTAGYTLFDNKITYSAATVGDELLSVSGISKTDGIEVTSNGITIDTSAVKAKANTPVTLDVSKQKGNAFAIAGAEEIVGYDG